MLPQELTEHFHRVIPISKNLGVRVLEVTDSHSRVSAPLSPNLNHVQTAFGGSLYSIAALACYALFKGLARNAGGASNELVIQEGRIQYLSPIKADFTVRAELADPLDREKFMSGISRRGKARLKLNAFVSCEGQICAKFEGVYVILT